MLGTAGHPWKFGEEEICHVSGNIDTGEFPTNSSLYIDVELSVMGEWLAGIQRAGGD